MRIEIEYQGELVTLEVIPSENDFVVRLPNGDEQKIRVRRLPNDIVQVMIISPEEIGLCVRTFRVPFARSDKETAFALNGDTYAFTPPAPRRAGKAQKTLSGALTAPMVGVVADVLVAEGQSVEKGQSLVILGAMKVYVTLSAPFNGTVKSVHVKKDDLVAHGALVVEVEPTPALPPREGEELEGGKPT